jgi:hypothetical protein
MRAVRDLDLNGGFLRHAGVVAILILQFDEIIKLALGARGNKRSDR